MPVSNVSKDSTLNTSCVCLALRCANVTTRRSIAILASRCNTKIQITLPSRSTTEIKTGVCYVMPTCRTVSNVRTPLPARNVSGAAIWSTRGNGATAPPSNAFQTVKYVIVSIPANCASRGTFWIQLRRHAVLCSAGPVVWSVRMRVRVRCVCWGIMWIAMGIAPTARQVTV
jgi:hypothetical protein